MTSQTEEDVVFTLNPALDADAFRACFAERGRIAIRDFLALPAAEALADHLEARTDWRMVFNLGSKSFELPRADRRVMPKADWTKLTVALDQAGRYEFQYRYEAVRVSDSPEERTRSRTLLERFAMFMSSPEIITFLCHVTGRRDILFADAQATCYSIGDFLTAHDDEVAGKHRSAAYVLGLTRVWRAEWGGLLLFHGQDGGIDEGYVPGFNVLNLFAVPSVHSVSSVAPIAAEERRSITGWLRIAPSGG